jgi:putative transcriptional regulator
MVAKKTRKPLFERLRQALDEGIAWSKGELTLRTVEVPEEPPEVDAETVTALRERIEMSQTVFARVLNVSPKTVQSWEQGTRKPSQASLRLIQVLSHRPEVLCELAGLKGVNVHGGMQADRAGGRKKLSVRPALTKRRLKT